MVFSGVYIGYMVCVGVLGIRYVESRVQDWPRILLLPG